MVKKFTLVKLIIISIVVPFTVIQAMGDEFMSCDSYSRRESRVLEAIPCDMTTTNYCKIKGPSYPEAAIWRFKEENRALMRRMYGDMESTSVYREMRQMSTNMDDEEQDSSRKSSLVYTGSGFMPDLFSGRYNIRMGSGLATVQSAKEPVVSESGSVEKIRIKVKKKIKKKIIKDKNNNNSVGTENSNDKNNNSDSIVKTSTTTSTSSVFATTSESPSPMSTTIPNESTKSPSPTTTYSASTMTTQIPFEEVTSFEDPNDTTTYNVEDQTNAEEEMDDEEFEEFIPDPEARIAATTMKYPPIEFEDPVKYEGESQHACPVLNEVFAPYWVNNTRNQVRAILNLHPFEQYIHMEKCLNEGEEMLCRKGCRCEQQYRLHRLLAFDPNNECRGIFSDWFRFPSYCICKCYNFPSDFLSKPENEPPSKDDDEKIVFEDNNIKQQPETLPNPSPQLQVLSQQNKGRSLQNIPVHLPYEAKQALLRELQSRNQRNMDQPFFYSAPVMEYNLSNGEQGTVGQTPRK